MKKLILIIFFISNQLINAQTRQELDIIKWKNYTYYNQILNCNLSAGFFYDSCSYSGIFGTNRSKINIRFDNVLKKNNELYEVKGKSLLKGKICNFIGNLIIERIEIIYLDIDNSEILLLAVGTYELNENDSIGGAFQGSFRKYMIYSWEKNIFFQADGYTERGSEEGFAGFWVNKLDNTSYQCHFGFERYPENIAGDFDIGNSEALVNPKYKKYGWSTSFEKDGDTEWGYYWSINCSDKWWKK